MQTIEFEATTFQHTIRVPDHVPDGVTLRVLLLVDDNIPNHTGSISPYLKNSLKNSTDIGDDKEADRISASEDENRRQAVLARIAAVRANWQGKPIPDRDVLYDNIRG